MIVREWQYVIICDACGVAESIAYVTKETIKANARANGWRIIEKNKAFCPDCAKRRRAEQMKSSLKNGEAD